MDPTACLANALASLGALAETEGLPRISAMHREEAIEHLTALADWLRAGGFAPEQTKILTMKEQP